MSEKPVRLLDVQGLKKHFTIRRGFLGAASGNVVKAVDGVSFFIEKGETLGLVGESGSGKTTIGRCILLALQPSGGRIQFCIDNETTELSALTGKDLRAFRRHIQMIFQDPYSSLNPRMTVRDIIADPLIASNLARGDDVDERVRTVALHCRLNIEHLRRYPHAFSGGQRQRIGIARALVMNPEFIVCDEPVSALDVSVQAQVLNLLQELQREYHLTYLFIAHDLSVVEHISHRVAVMYLGRLVEMAPTQELFYQPMHPYTEALMSAIPVADPAKSMRPLLLSGEIPNPANPPSGCHFHPRCHLAQEICKTEVPEWKEYLPGHFAACHLANSVKLRGVYALQGEGLTGQ